MKLLFLLSLFSTSLFSAEAKLSTFDVKMDCKPIPKLQTYRFISHEDNIWVFKHKVYDVSLAISCSQNRPGNIENFTKNLEKAGKLDRISESKFKVTLKTEPITTIVFYNLDKKINQYSFSSLKKEEVESVSKWAIQDFNAE